MITYTIQDLVGLNPLSVPPTIHKDVVYAIKNSNDVVLYVGKAGVTCVSTRIWRHIGDIFDKKARASKISKCLLNNHPAYFSWHVDVYTIADVNALTSSTHTCLSCAERALYDHITKSPGKPKCNTYRPRCP